jgi:antitoxin component YwqK of YwqJK toxin-antitoxin module
MTTCKTMEKSDQVEIPPPAPFQPLKVQYYGPTEQLEKIERYRYDEIGRTVSVIMVTADGETIFEKKIEWSSNTKLVKRYDSSGEVLTTVAWIYQDGLLDRREYRENGTVTGTLRYRYRDGLMEREEVVEGARKVVFTRKIRKRGDETVTISINSKGRPVLKEIVLIDTGKMETTTRIYSLPENTLVEERVSTLSRNLRTKEIVTKRGGEPAGKTILSYDENGNCIREVQYDGKEVLQTVIIREFINLQDLTRSE